MESVTGGRRVVLYGRTSLDKNEGRSVDDQLAELRRWAKRTGRTVVAELRDDGISASRYAAGKARPAWAEVMELLASGKVDELGVWEISRSTRDRAVWAGLLAACIEHAVSLAVDGKIHDPADPDGGFMLDLGAALAVRESAMLSKRLQRAVDSRAAAGRPHGKLLYGYSRVLDPDTGRPIARVVDPVAGPIVREVVRRLLARESSHAIARDLNRRGVRTRGGREWLGGNLAKLVQRPTYAGLRIHRGRVLTDVTATWEPLITPNERARLVAMFADPGRDKFRNVTTARHLGTGLFRCGRDECDGVMRTVVEAGKPNRYSCRRCHRVSRHQQPVDQLVEKLIVARLSQSDVGELLAGTGQDADTEAAAAEVVRLKARLREVREKVDTGELTLDDLIFFKARWEKQLADAERRARPRWIPADVYEVAGPDAAARWKAKPIAAKRNILAALFTVTIRPAGAGHWRFDPDLIEVDWRQS